MYINSRLLLNSIQILRGIQSNFYTLAHSIVWNLFEKHRYLDWKEYRYRFKSRTSATSFFNLFVKKFYSYIILSWFLADVLCVYYTVKHLKRFYEWKNFEFSWNTWAENLIEAKEFIDFSTVTGRLKNDRSSLEWWEIVAIC